MEGRTVYSGADSLKGQRTPVLETVFTSSCRQEFLLQRRGKAEQRNQEEGG